MKVAACSWLLGTLLISPRVARNIYIITYALAHAQRAVPRHNFLYTDIVVIKALYSTIFHAGIPPSFRPTCHIFYPSRCMDVDDGLTKYDGHAPSSSQSSVGTCKSSVNGVSLSLREREAQEQALNYASTVSTFCGHTLEQ